MEEQEGRIDFQALRAKFQDKELLLGPPKTKPTLPEKPKVIPPPLSPTHQLPTGARPSLLSSISQALESKTLNAPRVVFKEENKDAKKLLIHSNSKPKEKSDAKLKENKEKTKENNETLNENSLDYKEKNGKRLTLFGAQKESTAELVPASPPPKNKTQRKKNIFGFIKSSKKDAAATSAESILDSKTGDDAGPAPLIPVASDANNTAHESIYSVPKPILPKIATPERSAAVDLTRLSPIPEPPDFSPPPAIIPNIPVFKIPPPLSETPPQTDSPTLLVSNLPSQEKTVPNSPIAAPSPPTIAAPSPPTIAAPSPPTIAAPSPPTGAAPSPPTIAAPSPPLVSPRSLPIATSSLPTVVAPSPPTTPPPSPPPRAIHVPPTRHIPSPPPNFANSDHPSEASASSPSLPEIQVVDGSDVEATFRTAVDAMDSPSFKRERPISALSVLERAEDLNTGKKTSPSDQRILSALEKARKKAASPLSSPTPPPDDLLYNLNPTLTDVEFPPIHNDGKKPPSPEPEVNGIDHRTASPVLQNLTERGSDTPLELLVVPPPPPRRVLPDPGTLGSAPEKPERTPSVNLSEFIPPPPVIPEDIPVPLEFSEPDTADTIELDDLADAYSTELPLSDVGNEEYTGHNVPDEPNQSEFYGNGITDPETEVHTETAHEYDYQDNLPQEQSVQPTQNYSPPPEDPQGPYQHISTYESNDNMYEAVKVSSTKKKGKGKKQKGALKNPYVETAQETVQEKPKSNWFSRSEKRQNSEKLDEKELKKKEKQRLEKVKKELKEKQDREKKEQKEREKKEHEMKKIFCITGQEEAMYQAKVNVTAKPRKHELPVKSGDIVSIIRTNKCPKGKWLARDSSNNYGYVSLDHLEMDLKEMLEMGKKTPRNSTIIESQTVTDGKGLNNFSHSAESFSDDSDDWTCEDDEPYSPALETTDQLPGNHTRTISMPEMGNKDIAINHQHSHSDMGDSTQNQAKQEALKKLETFLNFSKSVTPAPTEPEPERSPTPVQEEDVTAPLESLTQGTEFDPTAVILPPPDMYADSTLNSSLYSESIKNLPR